MAKSKAPAFQFYPGDWLQDTALRACSVAARGLWIDMICIMHQGEPYGHLTLKGSPIDIGALARLVGCSSREATKWLKELEGAKVFDRSESGVIVSRRMVRDEAIRNVRREFGKLGGNPALLDKTDVGDTVNHPPTLAPPPSSSSSSPSPRTPPPPLPTAPPKPVEQEQQKVQRQLEEEVFECGVEDARRCVAKAQENGCTAAEIRAVILAWAKRGGDLGPGSLHYRLMDLKPGDDPERTWPKPTAEVQAKKHKETAADRERAEEQAYQQTAAESQKAAEDRERRFGPELDSMDPTEVEEMVKQNPAMAKLFRKGKSPLVRDWLLVQLQKRSEILS